MNSKETLLDKAASIKKLQAVEIDIHPVRFDELRFPEIHDLWRIIQQTRVSLRGWDLPHISHRKEELLAHEDWIGGWSDFMRHQEVWRFFQSGLFQFRSVVREEEEKYQSEIRKRTHFTDDSTFHYDLVQQLYALTEFYELAHRMATQLTYDDGVVIRIKYISTRDTVIGNSDFNRGWSGTDPCIYESIELGGQLSFLEITTRYRHHLLAQQQRWLNMYDVNVVEDESLIRIQDNLYAGGGGKDRPPSQYDWSSPSIVSTDTLEPNDEADNSVTE